MLEAKSLTQSAVSRGAYTVAHLTFDRFLSSAFELRQRADKLFLHTDNKQECNILHIQVRAGMGFPRDFPRDFPRARGKPIPWDDV